MSTHTPGPWLVGERIQRPNVETAQGLLVALCHAGADRSLNSAQANARLIAAAPDLLAALQAICSRVSAAGQDSTGQEMLKIRAAMIEEARAAVAKATGDAR